MNSEENFGRRKPAGKPAKRSEDEVRQNAGKLLDIKRGAQLKNRGVSEGRRKGRQWPRHGPKRRKKKNTSNATNTHYTVTNMQTVQLASGVPKLPKKKKKKKTAATSKFYAPEG
jgi:hypothetical protein